MIIPVHLAPSKDHFPTKLQPSLAKIGSNEVVLIELQGWLDVVEGEKGGGLIGHLKLDSCDKPVLIIGNHHLEGKLVPLSKPLAVLARNKVLNEGDRGATHYDIVTIVKRKITFSRRPVPIVKRT